MGKLNKTKRRTMGNIKEIKKTKKKSYLGRKIQIRFTMVQSIQNVV